ncbi:unnamed protein product [Rhizoctonia solani]|uniref:DUF6589 domain-containing protein n=1 Tax=Rhizoctonia solani TaxID=456999 RepID=A0A8H2WW62_9AGAM|nr:unnamed protein product [Rhizoctonia solani]
MSCYPGITAEDILGPLPAKRPRLESSDPPATFHERIDAVKCAFEENNITVADFIKATCAYDYRNQRKKDDKDFVLSAADAEAGHEVRIWAKEIACQELLKEAKQMEAEKLLHTGRNSCTVEGLGEWSPTMVYNHLCDHMPYFVSLLTAFIKDGKHSSENKKDDVPMAISIVGSVLWIKRSQKANYFAKGFGAYLYGSGTHAATINVLNRCGLSVSYSTLMESLESLNSSCIKRFRQVAAHCRSFFMWDNINLPSNIVEQRIKNAGSFESGTSASLVEFHPPPGCGPEAIDEALDPDKYLSALASAPDLKYSDVESTSEDRKNLRNEFAFEAIRILVEHGGDRFKQYKRVNLDQRPLIWPLLPPRITCVYPLPTIHKEQASASGNATIIEEIRRVTGLEISEIFRRRICVVTGDLLTISRVLSVRDVRTLYMRTPAHVKDPQESLSYMVPFCGLFHTRITAATAILHTHFGKPNARPKDAPISLWRHNEILKRKNIPIQQPVNYRTAQDLTFHSLYARILDVIRIESGCNTLDEFGDELNKLAKEEAWNRLKSTVDIAVTRFTNPNEAKQDDILRNSILFIRDSLIFRCFVTSIKYGNMSMIELILKIWATSFRGAGRSQYAGELLRLRHNLVHAWPKPLRDLILSNMLVNMTGKEDSWKETDLLQEHMNFWIKVVYKARGPSASWTWLEGISSCITTLRELTDKVNTSLAPHNSTHHTSPSLQADLDALVKSLVEERIHTQDLNRCCSDESFRAKDVMAAGCLALKGLNSPIEKFNKDRFGAQRPGTHTAGADDRSTNANTQDETQGASAEVENEELLIDVVIDDGSGDIYDPFDLP